MTDIPRERADNQLLGHTKLYLTDDRCSMMGPDAAVCRVRAPLTSGGQFKVLPVCVDITRAVPFGYRRNTKSLHLIPLYPRNHASFKQNGAHPTLGPGPEGPKHPCFTTDQLYLHHKTSMERTRSESSIPRNFANQLAGHTFTTQRRRTFADKEVGEPSVSISPAPASAKGPPKSKRSTKSMTTRIGNWLFWLIMILLIFLSSPALGQVSLSQV